MKLDIIAGARPNFMKIAPIIEELEKVQDRIKYRLIHTGQSEGIVISSLFCQKGAGLAHIV